jgi:NitT/TauT family transport system substrate-binding protein
MARTALPRGGFPGPAGRIGLRSAGALALGVALWAGAGAQADAQEQPVIHVALSPFEAQSNVYYAQDLGLFKRAGLNIDIQQVQGSAAIVAAIVGGTVQIGTGSMIPAFSARERGIDLVLVAPGTLSDFAQQQSGIVTSVTSTARTGKDLTGKVVGVNTLHSVDEVSVDSWVDKTGGDSHTVKFVEVPGTLMLDALTSGRLDAAVMANPAYTIALESGRARQAAFANESIAKRFMITAWFASRSWANANPDALRKFASALDEASSWAVKNPDAAAAVLRKYLHTTTQRAHEQHARSLDPGLLQPLADAAAKYGVLPKPLDVREMIWR